MNNSSNLIMRLNIRILIALYTNSNINNDNSKYMHI